MYIIRQEIMMSNSPFKTVIAIVSSNDEVITVEKIHPTVNITEIKSNTI
jgi:hypothetical protein